ncbi:hypothetical protein E2C01_065635 [Portunus trituberculatus]|uniref:Uncharacterized protein n=1 Tax=Portunus trituberculatus TaxID=210409 RepID=A0A5B7HRM9_PORTR|nr:hypothetical protein [Portunus trituberculatus]
MFNGFMHVLVYEGRCEAHRSTLTLALPTTTPLLHHIPYRQHLENPFGASHVTSWKRNDQHSQKEQFQRIQYRCGDSKPFW